MRLPRELIGFIVEQGERTRKEAVRRVGREVRRAISRADLAGELARALEGLRVRIEADISFDKRPDSPSGEKKASELTTERVPPPPDNERG